MRWRWVICAAMVFLAGCVYSSSGSQDTAYKNAFVKQLIGYCARVDNQLAGVDVNSQPGKYAQQLGTFAHQARSHHPPNVDRQQLDVLLTAFDDASRQFQSAQTALNHGNTGAAHSAVQQATRTMQRANKIAQRYGMPPLNSCPKAAGQQAQPAWQSGTDSLLAVQQAPAAVLNGRIWLIGGLTGPLQATKEVQVYNPTVRTWGPGPALPVALNHAMVVPYRGTLWVIGGFESGRGIPTAVASPKVFMYDQAKNDWVGGPSLHHARAAAAVAVVGNKIVVAGGRTGDPGKDVLPTEVYNGASWQDATPIPTPGDHLAAASDGTYLYVVGGEKLSSSFALAAVQRFDPASGKWTQLPSMPAAATNVGAAIVGGQLIAIGGETFSGVLNTVRALNLTTDKWSSLPPLPRARHGMGVAVINSTVYVIGGTGQTGHNGSSENVQVLTLHS